MVTDLVKLSDQRNFDMATVIPLSDARNLLLKHSKFEVLPAVKKK